MKKEYKKLIKNTSIFAVGTFGSKILVFLIVPLYTYVLSTSDYGIVDLITSTGNLLIPFSTLLIYEAVIRFLVAKECDEKTAFNNSVFIFVVGIIFTILFSPLLLHLLRLSNYYIIFISLIIFNSYSTIFGQFLRATGDNWGFSVSGIIHTLFTVLLNLIFLLWFKMGINGYLYALLISQLLTCIFIFFRVKSSSMIDLKMIDFSILKLMLLYSLPLVPNNLMWWIMNAGDKYVINYYLGASANGLFSISYKIPTILTMLFSIFMQAWQVSAIEERENKKGKEFYKNVFILIYFMLMICTSIIIFGIKPLFEIVMGKDFIVSWKYVPLLCVATLFNCFSTFAGVVYIVSKNSKKSFITTFIGAFLNLLFNFMLIKKLGLYGVAIGTIIGYFFVMILRFFDYKKTFSVSLIDKSFIISIILLTVDSFVYIFVDGIFRYIFSFICVLIILFLAKDYIGSIVQMFRKKLSSKKE